MEAIPLVNLARQISTLRDELTATFHEVLESCSFIQGQYVERLEREVAAAHDVSHGIGCSNGTAAISLALQAAGIGAGDEVIVPSHTFFATASAVCHAGATPVFADVEPEAYTLDPGAVATKLSPRTKAIMPVHIYGTPCRLDALSDLARDTGAILIEDAAQAHLAFYAGRYVGAWGEAATLSFYPGKNLGAFGDAGMVITNSAGLAQRVRLLRDHGRSSKYIHEILGYNHRMDGLQAALISVKLRRLQQWNARRREVAAHYDSAVIPRQFKVIRPPKNAVPVYHLYVVEVSNRDEVQKHLRAHAIATGIHYPVPLHLQPPFRELAGGSLPVTERIADRVLSLPICGEISPPEQERVIQRFVEVARP